MIVLLRFAINHAQEPPEDVQRCMKFVESFDRFRTSGQVEPHDVALARATVKGWQAASATKTAKCEATPAAGSRDPTPSAPAPVAPDPPGRQPPGSLRLTAIDGHSTHRGGTSGSAPRPRLTGSVEHLAPDSIMLEGAGSSSLLPPPPLPAAPQQGPPMPAWRLHGGAAAEYFSHAPSASAAPPGNPHHVLPNHFGGGMAASVASHGQGAGWSDVLGAGFAPHSSAGGPRFAPAGHTHAGRPPTGFECHASTTTQGANFPPSKENPGYSSVIYTQTYLSGFGALLYSSIVSLTNRHLFVAAFVLTPTFIVIAAIFSSGVGGSTPQGAGVDVGK